MNQDLQKHNAPLGLIAGGGKLPRVLADSVRQHGGAVFVVALKGSCEDGWLNDIPHIWVRPEQVGKTLRTMRKAGCKDVVLIGHVKRPSVRELRPDFKGLWWVWKLWSALRNLGDDGLLRAIRALLEDEGFALKSIQDFVAEVLAPVGQLGSVAAPADVQNDIRKGLVLSQMIGRLDIGQAVVVQDGLVLGLEAIEGTDALIKRTAPLQRSGRGAVLVKTAKPQQDRALDLPTLGPDTIKSAADAGFTGIVYSAGSVLLADAPQMIELADARGIFLLGVDMADVKDRA